MFWVDETEKAFYLDFGEVYLLVQLLEQTCKSIYILLKFIDFQLNKNNYTIKFKHTVNQI